MKSSYGAASAPATSAGDAGVGLEVVIQRWTQILGAELDICGCDLHQVVAVDHQRLDRPLRLSLQIAQLAVWIPGDLGVLEDHVHLLALELHGVEDALVHHAILDLYKQKLA